MHRIIFWSLLDDVALSSPGHLQGVTTSSVYKLYFETIPVSHFFCKYLLRILPDCQIQMRQEEEDRHSRNEWKTHIENLCTLILNH